MLNSWEGIIKKIFSDEKETAENSKISVEEVNSEDYSFTSEDEEEIKKVKKLKRRVVYSQNAPISNKAKNNPKINIQKCKSDVELLLEKNRKYIWFRR